MVIVILCRFKWSIFVDLQPLAKAIVLYQNWNSSYRRSWESLCPVTENQCYNQCSKLRKFQIGFFLVFMVYYLNTCGKASNSEAGTVEQKITPSSPPLFYTERQIDRFNKCKFEWMKCSSLLQSKAR